MKKKLLFGLLILFIVAQAIQPSKNRGAATGPGDVTHAVSVPGNIVSILKKSCYDCHSNHTEYPWFDHITPANWWVANHIKEGRIELNFTEFGRYSVRKQVHKLKEIRETVEAGEMPLKSYLILHPGVRLSGSEKNMLIDWTINAANEIMQRPDAR